MRRVRKQLLAVPDKLAKAAKPQLLAQPHNRRGRDKCRLRQLAHRDVAHQQWMLSEVGETRYPRGSATTRALTALPRLSIISPVQPADRPVHPIHSGRRRTGSRHLRQGLPAPDHHAGRYAGAAACNNRTMQIHALTFKMARNSSVVFSSPSNTRSPHGTFSAPGYVLVSVPVAARPLLR